jgi:hypothetical protein
MVVEDCLFRAMKNEKPQQNLSIQKDQQEKTEKKIDKPINPFMQRWFGKDKSNCPMTREELKEEHRAAIHLELARYLTLSVVPDNDDSLTWWFENRFVFPHLSKCAFK